MRYFLIAALLCLGGGQAFAQAVVSPCVASSSNASGITQSSCNPVTATNPLPVSASVSVGGFTPGLTFATLTATNASASVALPAGATVVFQNTGTTAVSCTLGIGSATALANQIIIQPSSSRPVVVGSNTFGACIDQTGSASNVVVLMGGAGLDTGYGGGGGSGGGGPVTAISGAYADGAITTLGTQADSVCATATGTCTLEALVKFLNSSVTSAIPAGSNLIGDVNLRQGGTALSATNGVFANQLQSNAVLSVTNPTFTQTVPGATGGLTSFFVQPTASDNHAVLKNGAGQVYHVSVTNNSATVNYLRLYNAGTGFNGCNSATNLVGQWAIPASTSVGGITFPFPEGMAFSTGISICITSGYATTDTTAATASAMSVNVGFK